MGRVTFRRAYFDNGLVVIHSNGRSERESTKQGMGEERKRGTEQAYTAEEGIVQ